MIIKIILIIGILIIYLSRFRPSVFKRVKNNVIKSIYFVIIEFVVAIIIGAQLYFIQVEYGWLTYIGLVLFLLGLLLTTLARLKLRHNYMPAFSTQAPDEVVTNGVYKIVRHPVYLGMILFITGIELILTPELVVIVLVAILIFIHQIIKEENIMVHSNAKDWNSFKSKTKYRLFPFIW